MPSRSTQPAYTSDLRMEFEAEIHSLLRRRFIRFAGIMGIITSSLLLMSLAAWTVSKVVDLKSKAVQSITDLLTPDSHQFLTWLFGMLIAATYGTCYLAAKRGSFTRQGMLRFTYLLVVADGVLHVTGASLEVAGSLGLFGVMLTHVIASFFLPWTPAQAVLPLIPVLALRIILGVVIPEDPPATLATLITAAVFTAAPGTLICWFRHSARMERFKLRFFQRRYGEVRRELFDARRIHEALFPAPLADGPVRFTYLYEPMHQIGGDYLYAALSPDKRSHLSIILMDVTGHGIPAALTVNRLHGELQRQFAEDPEIRPGQTLTLLNRYVHLTLANHAVFVTALCMRFDLINDTVEYASGGHPTAYLRAVDGTIHELASTAVLLGALADVDFTHNQSALPFVPGDSLIACTDGAIEARDAAGRMIGLRGMQRLVATLNPGKPGNWPAALVKAIDAHRNGPPNDDTLLIEVFRPLATLSHKPLTAETTTASLPQPV